jgi:hypothetical protein
MLACRDILAPNGVSRRALANPWLLSRNGTLLVGVGRNQAGVHREALAANQTFLDAPADDSFENMPEDIAFPEAAVTVLRKCGMGRDRGGKTSGRRD